MSEGPSKPLLFRRRTLLAAGAAGALAALVSASRLHWPTRAEARARTASGAVREGLLAFLGTLFGRELTAEDRADLGERLALLAAEPALAYDCAVLSHHLDRLAHDEGAQSFASCAADGRERVVERLMAIDPRSPRARVLEKLAVGMRDFYRMRSSTIPSLEWLYRHSAAAWRARGYTRWPGIPGDWRETLVPGAPYP
jgi:hypothetical protein